jgi:two-component system, OmpR family, phosphate regulon sensor histidine kinase PhoR
MAIINSFDEIGHSNRVEPLGHNTQRAIVCERESAPNMFWRLFLTYLLLVVTAVGLVGVVIYQRAEHIFYDLARVVGVTVVLVVFASVGAAYALARRFARPLDELTLGARRLAEGDFGHKIRVSGGREHSTLAETFNSMSGRLASMFDLIEHDREQLRAILSGMVEGVIAIDDDQRMLFANDRAGALLGFESSAVVGSRLNELTCQQGFREIVERGLAGTEPHREELD